MLELVLAQTEALAKAAADVVAANDVVGVQRAVIGLLLATNAFVGWIAWKMFQLREASEAGRDADRDAVSNERKAQIAAQNEAIKSLTTEKAKGDGSHG